MKPKANAFFRASRIALITVSLSASVHAGTTWDGGGGANTNIDLADNWDGTAPGVVNSLNGTTAAIFATGGNAAAMNVPARFTTITFNRNDAGGFSVSGASTLSANQATAGGTINLAVSDTAGNGVSSIGSPFQVNTDAGGANRFLNIKNDEKDVPAGSLLVSGGISASTAANTYVIRAGGTGVTVLSGTLSHVAGIQQVNSGTSSGKVIVNGSQNLGGATVNVPTTTSGTVTSAYTIQMGNSTADVQSWGSTTINQNAIVSVKSTATLSGAVAIGGVTGATGATMVVDGALSATTLSIGTTAVTGNLKIGGSASFSGNVTIGATAGNSIVGNAVSNGTLSLSSGTISSNVTIGGANPNEDNLSLTKINAGILTLNGDHTYTGATNVNAGTLNLGGTLESPITVKAGATLGGEGSTFSSLTFDVGNSALQFDPGGTTTDALTADTVDVSTAGIVYVSPTAATTPASTYTVLKQVTGSFSPADLEKFALSTRGGTLSISLSGKEITLTAAAATPVSLVWKGNAGDPTYWDIATTLNWDNSGAERFYTGDAVTFNDTASEFNVAVQGASVAPGNIVFNNTIAYNLSGGGIGGAGSLTKNNSGTVTLANALSHSGGITVNAGVLDLGAANNTFTGGINVAGGELKFGGAALPNTGSLNSQPITLGGGTITRNANANITNESQTVTINTHGSTIKIDTNANVTWRIGGKVSGAGNWIKSGAGVLALSNNTNAGPGNDFTGTVTVTAGTLDVRHGDSLGATAGGTSIQSAILLMQNFNQTSGGTITVNEPLEFSGSSFLTGYNQENKTFTQRFNGPITVAAGANLGISTARTTTNPVPTLELNGTSISTGAGSVLSLGTRPASYPAGNAAAAQTINIAAAITGPGAVTAQGDATFMSVYTLSGANTYTGNTTVNDNASLTLAATTGQLRFKPTTNGVTNSVGGTGTVTVNGKFVVDLTGATVANGNSWTLLDKSTLTASFSDSDFGIETSAAVAFTDPENDGTWTLVDGSNTWSFNEADGKLSLAVTAGTGYAAWQSANAPGQTVAQDHDNDGVDNGIEYFMGQSGSGFTALPVLNPSNNITWTMADGYSGTYGTHYVVQTSSDLTTWTPVDEVDVAIDNIAPGKSVSYTLGGPGKRFVRLLVNPN